MQTVRIFTLNSLSSEREAVSASLCEDSAFHGLVEDLFPSATRFAASSATALPFLTKRI